MEPEKEKLEINVTKIQQEEEGEKKNLRKIIRPPKDSYFSSKAGMY